VIDVFVAGILRRLERGDLRHDGVTDQERQGLHVLTGKGLATFGEQPEPRVSRLSWRITDAGRELVQ